MTSNRVSGRTWLREGRIFIRDGWIDCADGRRYVLMGGELHVSDGHFELNGPFHQVAVGFRYGGPERRSGEDRRSEGGVDGQ